MKNREYFLKVTCSKCGATLMLADAVAEPESRTYRHAECAPVSKPRDALLARAHALRGRLAFLVIEIEAGEESASQIVDRAKEIAREAAGLMDLAGSLASSSMALTMSKRSDSV
jgi:hypothetical protein